MELRNGNVDDIRGDLDSIFMNGLIWFIIITVILALLIFLGWGMSDSPETVARNNATAEVFNGLPEETRISLAGILEKKTDAEHKLTIRDEPRPFREVFTNYLLPISIALIILGYSIGVSYAYHQEKSHRHRYADLPLHKVYGWLILISILPATFWWLIASAVRLIPHKIRDKRARDQETLEEAQREENRERRAREELLLGHVPEKVSFRDDREAAAKTYVELRHGGWQKMIDMNRRAFTSNIAEAENDLRQQGENIQRMQSEIAEMKTELANYEKMVPVEVTPESAAKEFLEILKMRGVSKVYADDTIHILVEARVPHEGHLYDFGDWELKLSAGSWNSKQRRSGVRPDWEGGYPDYRYDGKRFCFGSRQGSISQLYSEGRLIEAVTLMIDSMHSVNDESERAAIPRCFYRIRGETC